MDFPRIKTERLTLRGRELVWGARTLVMGIINLTPDSFSGDGLLSRSGRGRLVDSALQQAQRFVQAGADILDLGGESTRPGAEPVSPQEEIDRVLPVVERLVNEQFTLISVDTYRAATAAAALSAGAHIINDVWGLRVDPDLAGVAAQYRAPVILMHNRSSWANTEIRERLGGRYIGMQYDDLIADVRRELMESVAIAQAAGICEEHILLDPGVGFGKTVEQNLELINRLDEIRSLGYPVLLGPSRKSFIGYTLDLPPEQRLEGTTAACAIGIARGADILRVHDVEAIVRVARMSDAIIRSASRQG